MTNAFLMRLVDIQPSQLFISARKLSRVREGFDPLRPETLEPIPVKRLGGRVISTDGHTRAFAARAAGLLEVRVSWDEDELDWEAYEICLCWCDEAGVQTIADLRDRVVSAEEYERLWRKRCQAMHEWLEQKRRKDAQSC